ncbi:hypothetical protein [Streptomyces sp. NBC_00083]|uniref:hypothetical protein n=1 Tax=Streptomyces sp. NBC_00083 TaxID=2975647 RepID=UPI00225113E4|nr:hypothetical protein [Streptomyces sp. NBC_00083]
MRGETETRARAVGPEPAPTPDVRRPAAPVAATHGGAERRVERFARLLGRSVGRGLRREFRSIVLEPVRELVRRGLSGVLLAVLVSAAVLLLHAVDQTRTGATLVRLTSHVRGDIPLPLVLLRTPLSLFVPARDLPALPGIPVLFTCFALAQLVLGRTRTLVVAYAASFAGTIGARVMLAAGPRWWGLPAEAAHVIDTGASAAVVGLFAHIAALKRAPVLFVCAVMPTVLRSFEKPNLAGREHIVAITFAVALGLFAGRERDGTTGRREALAA